MFTGIVEELGRIQTVRPGAVSSRLEIACSRVLQDVQLGDSIAVNGVCLTVTEFASHYFAADVMAESIRRSNLSQLKAGSIVNLERALTLNKRLGGHIVSGHIDGIGRILARKPEDNAVWFTVEAPSELLRLMVPKGSIAIDGISLTLVSVAQNQFTVSIIPHTMGETTLGTAQPGRLVNLETDLIGKYVFKRLEAQQSTPTQKSTTGLDLETLMTHGFL